MVSESSNLCFKHSIKISNPCVIQPTSVNMFTSISVAKHLPILVNRTMMIFSRFTFLEIVTEPAVLSWKSLESAFGRS